MILSFIMSGLFVSCNSMACKLVRHFHVRDFQSTRCPVVQRGNFQVDDQLYTLSPSGDPKSAAHLRLRTSNTEDRSATVSIDGIDHDIAPVSVEEMRLYDSATPLHSRSSGTISVLCHVHFNPVFCCISYLLSVPRHNYTGCQSRRVYCLSCAR